VAPRGITPESLTPKGGSPDVALSAVALIETEPYVRSGLRRWLEPAGFEVLSVGEDALDSELVGHARLYVIGNHREDPGHISSLIERLGRARPGCPIFILAWASSERLAVAALKAGAADYFPPPIELQEVAAAILRCTGAHEADPEGRSAAVKGQAIVGESSLTRDLRGYLLKVAQRECNTLVLGETGTGKDLVAEAIHSNSPRRGKPLVCVNCAAIPDALLESELFGYEKGAFTGADGAAEGKIRQAHGGTMFFDEIGDMTPYAQAKILRVIESKEIQRLGGKAAIPVNVRIIAATNRDLEGLISDQRFRKDLYFRLNVVKIRLAPLRERRDDIPSLLHHYVGVFNRMTGSRVKGFTAHALERLKSYDWPGNVRELKSVVESVFIDPPEAHIDEGHLPWARAEQGAGPAASHERDQLLEALQITQWNKSKAAERLRWSRMKIYRKMAQYHIDAQPETAAAAHVG
jgi:DNA-binding NtrC family response regulator